ncbi:hypothetical protein M2160_007628 [Streptomyces sp. SAI-117]|uniref:hypothetical protein n=1 Tax=unclassified Streptomyces TaxID=2593676 RepID=UPI00247577BA|nr:MULTISPECIES: hypothetical protein [unclassified Streptomyces]MDH6553525.1 hypothetical protein [Streptomyces sp. SAI-041]MDH6572607.1 hypothetical protein [Streptomyces sp. SAI-117]MDH6582433.1 hypothetical protein [Streptomyces sp. SAI-133]
MPLNAPRLIRSLQLAHALADADVPPVNTLRPLTGELLHRQVCFLRRRLNVERTRTRTPAGGPGRHPS